MTAAAATAASQQLWTSGGALIQRAQEPNIPFGESLTSISHPYMYYMHTIALFVFCYGWPVLGANLHVIQSAFMVGQISVWHGYPACVEATRSSFYPMYLIAFI